MTRPRHTTDGFIPRRPGTPLSRNQGLESHKEASPTRFVAPAKRPSAAKTGSVGRSEKHGLTKSDIDESLNGLDDVSPKPAKRRLRFIGRPRSIRKFIKRLIIFIVLMAVCVGGYVAWQVFVAGGDILKGSMFGLIQAQPLKEDSNGRTNVLVLGTSEDDPGHGGAYLTDSMMVISANQTEKTAAMFSIPRDLYVKYGKACNSGYEGKINEYFNCVNPDWESEAAEEERLEQTRKFVGDIFGLDIQYAVHINNTVLKEAVDAVDGVDVEIEGSGGAPGVLDRNFDWRCNYTCHYVKYDNGVHHLDGEHALYLAMARGDVAPTYGLGNSNFDREKNQQKILLALKDKAVSTGSLTDIGRVTGLVKALGNNLRTNFATNEFRTLMQLGLDIKPESIQRISLNDDERPMVTGASYGGASVVVPVTGVFRYDTLRAYIHQQFNAGPLAKEAANIVVLNGSGVAGAAQTEADKLAAEGLIVSQVDNAPDGEYVGTQVYQRTAEGMSATKARLESMYGATVKTDLPILVNGDVDFVIIIGVGGASQ